MHKSVRAKNSHHTQSHADIQGVSGFTPALRAKLSAGGGGTSFIPSSLDSSNMASCPASIASSKPMLISSIVVTEAILVRLSARLCTVRAATENE